VTLDLGAIFTDQPGTYPATITLYEANGEARAARGSVTVAPDAQCGAPVDGGVAGTVTGHYTATNLIQVQALDAGPATIPPLPSLSGTFRVDMICESGGS
jgi:hypothetical protein